MFKLTINTLLYCVLISIIFSLHSCSEETTEPTNGVDGLNGFNALVEVQNESIGVNCSTGGIRISVGQDINENGVLDESEINSVTFVCNGTDGSSGENGIGLVARTSPENPGQNCENGGTLIEIGTDQNDNNSLDDNELQTSFYVCNGNDGTNGGEQGSISLIRVSSSISCANGGITIDIGIDNNQNNSLDDGEVSGSYDICNGQDGSNGSNGISTLSNVKTEPSGSNCENGGIKIELGLDNNQNGTLDSNEIISENYVCNGLDGANGRKIIVVTDTDVTCPNGGIELTFGYDDNDDGTIDEILEIALICNGVNGNDGSDGSEGLNSIVRTTTENPSTNCPSGGRLIEVGIDDNNNNTLDAPEVDTFFYICNGEDGDDGANGDNSLITVSSFSGSQGGCSNGGLVIRTGVDDNGNGVLNTSEIDATSYICNGDDGTDGSSDGIFEFYFQEGFDGYTGVIDASISDKNPTETGELFSVDRGTTDSHALLQFPELETLTDLVGQEFELVEAILYLRGVSGRVDGQSQGNWIGVKTLMPEAPLFEENAVTWTRANSADQNWTLPGVTSQDQDGNANGYSDMFQLPATGNFAFDGYIPLQLSLSEVSAWTDRDTGKDNNKGLVLLMANPGIQYDLDIFSSSYEKDENFRPLLYLKVKTGIKGRVSISEREYSEKWKSLTYKEKLAPLKKKSK